MEDDAQENSSIFPVDLPERWKSELPRKAETFFPPREDEEPKIHRKLDHTSFGRVTLRYPRLDEMDGHAHPCEQ